MRAAVFKGNGKMEIENRPIPLIEKGDDVILRVEAASICGTEVSILSIPLKHSAKTDVVLGHEYIGEVEELGSDVKDLKVGKVKS